MLNERNPKQNTPSVIARLMGLDELPPCQPLPKQKRVLSDNYLRGAASVGVWRKSSSLERLLFRSSAKDEEELKDIFALLETLKRDKHRKASVAKRKTKSGSEGINSEFLVQKGRDADSFLAGVKLQTLKEGYDKHVLVNSQNVYCRSYPQKSGFFISKQLHDRYGRPHGQSRNTQVLNSSSSPKCGKTSICKNLGRRSDERTTNNLMKAENGPVTVSIGKSNSNHFSRLSRNRFRSKNVSCDAKTRIDALKPNCGTAEKAFHCFASLRAHEDSDSDATKQMGLLSPGKEGSYAELRENKTFADDMGFIRQKKRVSIGSVEVIARQARNGMSHISRETSGLGSRAGKTLEKDPKTVIASSPNLDKDNSYGQNFTVSMSSSQRNLLSSENNGFVQQNLLKGSWRKKKLERSNSTDQSTSMADIVAFVESEDYGMSSENHKQQKLGSTAHDSPFHIPKVSNQQGFSAEISEECSVSSNHSSSDPEFNLEEGYQPSPASVLEPSFEEKMSEGSNCSLSMSLHGLQQQLEILKSGAYEEYFEGSRMIVSSDEDSVDYSGEKDVIRSFRGERKNCYYIDDVLTETGFKSRNQGHELWYSSECPISPMIFEKLEKKYGKQTSWKRSERRLLFDRVNSGLIEIFQPCTSVFTWVKPVSRRLRPTLEVVDELQIVLVSQENENSLNLLGKDDRWLELEDDIEIIGGEIENLLINELVAEVVSTCKD